MKILLTIILYLLWSGLYSQSVVKGRLIDSFGSEIPYANIIELETGSKTITDINGQFEIITTNDTAKLSISYVGYTMQEVTIYSDTTLEICMTSTRYNSQEGGENSTYKYVHIERDGLKDRSDLSINSEVVDSLVKNNVSGFVQYERVIKDSLGRVDSIVRYYTHATLVFANRRDTFYYSVNDSFRINVPTGKYRFYIDRVGVGFVNSNIRIQANTNYTIQLMLKPRRMLSNTEYECKTKRDRRKLKRNLKSPEKKVDCNCENVGITIYG